ncbi:hypothetical protein NFHSH190041_11120 [Shewanella sp. NFH-SH190041]|nr:hypothetical protein NFHSH190041_11120 [Shewanella sp. NFH-SH190041]
MAAFSFRIYPAVPITVVRVPHSVEQNSTWILKIRVIHLAINHLTDIKVTQKNTIGCIFSKITRYKYMNLVTVD